MTEYLSSEVNSINTSIKPTLNRKPIIFACIAALNEERTIGIIIKETKKYVNEIFVCDDGSSDLTGDLAESLGAHVVRHKTNKGKGAALRDIFKIVQDLKPDIVVVLDADSQHSPSDIPTLCEPLLKREVDMVIGSRFLDGSESEAPFYRRFGLKIFNFNGMLGVNDVQSGFRAFSVRP